jgi:hypothetical protein
MWPSDAGAGDVADVCVMLFIKYKRKSYKKVKNYILIICFSFIASNEGEKKRRDIRCKQ